MNSICITGNIVRDMEARAMPNGDPVGSFSVADGQGKDKQAIFWNCQLFGKRVSALAPYLMKGQQVTVVGTVTEREWIDKEGGKRKQMEIRVSDLALQGGKREQSAAPAPRARAHEPATTFAGGFQNDEDPIPF